MEDQYIVKKIDIPNGETLAYREVGTSSTVLILLHGASISSYCWTPYLSKLSQNLRVVAPDFRGHGDSTYNKPFKNHDDLTLDIKMFVEALGLKKFFLLGASTGGCVAMNFTAKYPEYIEGLILLSSIGAQGFPIYKIGPDGKPTEERITTEEDTLNHPNVIFLSTMIQQQEREKLKGLTEQIMYTGRYKPTNEVFQKILDDSFKCKCYARTLYANNVFNITAEDNPAAKGTNEISKIKCRVLILHGEKDMIVAKEVAQKTKDLLGDIAELKILPEAGHSLMEDYPEEFISFLENFCSK